MTEAKTSVISKNRANIARRLHGVYLDNYQDLLTWTAPRSPFEPYNMIESNASWSDYAEAVARFVQEGPVRILDAEEVLFTDGTKPKFDGIEQNRWLAWLEPSGYYSQLPKFRAGAKITLGSTSAASVNMNSHCGVSPQLLERHATATLLGMDKSVQWGTPAAISFIQDSPEILPLSIERAEGKFAERRVFYVFFDGNLK